jgi:hypothetical protein
MKKRNGEVKNLIGTMGIKKGRKRYVKERKSVKKEKKVAERERKLLRKEGGMEVNTGKW